ncbi:MAG: alpha-1,4-glucan--maltose-1-phosphate maltosyltransferase [Gemmatimonadota bacterium]|jgi:starch synthase (maltosyl-transferring)
MAATDDLSDPRRRARSRAVIEGVEPEIDCGKFPAKAVVGDPFVVEADVFGDGHDALRCVLLHRTERQRKWREVEMWHLGNDRWRGSFVPDEPGPVLYTVTAWVDRWGSWLRDLRKRVAADQDIQVDLLIGAGILDDYRAETGAEGLDKRRIQDLAERLRETARALDPASVHFDLEGLVDDLEGDAGAPARRHDPRRFATTYEKELPAFVDRERAAFSAWYELFPRSTGRGTEHGTFRTAEATLEYVAELGFDVVYLPPIHPIGRTKRKGPDNDPLGGPDAVGSPWAIGAREGGHTAIHPDLGTFDDFERFRLKAEALGMEVALDVAFQVSPDHPWVREHPEWFERRPDGTVQFAENPPKKYEDIYPIDFETTEWKALWDELKGVFEFWMDRGVRIFRVDNPHTKSFAFWAWCVEELRRKDPGVILLAEAFTRPRIMYHLAKLGFNQSYTYFAWRHHPAELRAYLEELTRGEARHFFRPNFWPNTPDILTETLQHGGRGAFIMRLVLAATLSSSYGIYGPAFELLEHRPAKPGSEEYLSSEKYEIRDWDLEAEDSLRWLLQRVNEIRREMPALRRNDSLRFHHTDNDQLLAYSKRVGMPVPPGRADVPHPRDPLPDTPDVPPSRDTVLCVVNMDPYHRQSGWVDLDLGALGLDPDARYLVHDLVSDDRYEWHGGRNWVELDPRVMPAHVFRLIRSGRADAEEDASPHV